MERQFLWVQKSSIHICLFSLNRLSSWGFIPNFGSQESLADWPYYPGQMHHSLLSLDPHLVTCFIVFQIMREKWESYLGSREPRIQMTLPPPPCPFKIYIQVPNDQFANWISWLLGSSFILVGAWKHQLSCALLAELLSLSHLTLRPHDLQHSRLPCPSPSPSLLKLMSIELMMPSNHLLIPSFALSQHQDLFHWVGSSHEVAKVLETQHQFSPLIVCRFLLLVRLFATSWTVTR